MASTSPLQIVILGGSFAAVQSAHFILKHIAPTKPVKVTIIAPSPDLYWVPGAPRTILNIPTRLDPETAFSNIPTAFRTTYGADKEGSLWQYELAWARQVNPAARTVTYELIDSTVTKSITYDQLIIATGTRNYNPHQAPPAGSGRAAEIEHLAPFKPLGTTAETKASIKQWGDAILAANTIFIAGAGATGIEVAAEIAETYPKKKVIIAGNEFLGQCQKKVQDVARKQLAALGVEIRTGVSVTSVRGAATGQGVDVTLSTGETVPADLYLPSFGQKPNTEFLPTELLDKDGYVVTTTHFNLASYANVWAVGDVTHWPGNRKLTVVGEHIPILAFNLKKTLEGQTEGWKEYKHSTSVAIFVTVGKNGGTGQIGWFRPWNWLVWIVKSRNMLINLFPGFAPGTTTPKKL
ncbi:hypothetical protein DFH27DRAFT_606216 [Peziza echinospora]|nr:hypothetical protein DFH27DRAFT_606216 [Peziza echinospora]